MENLTLDVFWLEFMPVYQHSIGGTTIALSVLVTYLILTKTPDSGRVLSRYLLLIQATILFCDFSWCFISTPVLLFPLPAAFCSGLLCDSDLGAHISIVFLYQSMSLVAMTVACTLHYKYTVIARMTNSRRVTTCENVAVRLFYFVILELPVAGILICGASQQNLRELVVSEHQYSLFSLLEPYNLRGVAYSVFRHFWIAIIQGVFVVISLSVIVAASYFFVIQTLRMLSSKTASMSERTRKVQRGLMKTLLMQLVTPFFLQIGPLSIYTISVTQLWFDPGIINAVLCVQLFHASFHSGFLILTTPSYRAALMCSKHQRKHSVAHTIVKTHFST